MEQDTFGEKVKGALRINDTSEFVIGSGVAYGSFAVMNSYTQAGENLEARQAIDSTIRIAEDDQAALEGTKSLLSDHGLLDTYEIDGMVAAKQQQITELQVQRETVGNEVLDNMQLVGLPLVLGAMAAAYTFKKIRRS